MTRGRDEGSVYRRKSDGRWVAVLRWPDGKKKYRYARTQREASAQLVELHALRRDSLPPPRDRLTVGQWLDEWMERYVSHLAPQTQRSYGHFTDTYLPPLPRGRRPDGAWMSWPITPLDAADPDGVACGRCAKH